MDRILRVAIAAAILCGLPTAWAKDDKWVEARSKNFVVVSNASAQQARSTAIQFEQIRDLFRHSFAHAQDYPTPVVTVLAAKDENTLRSLLPEYWETKGHVHPAGMFIDSLYQPQIAVQLSLAGDNPYEAIYHEYYHSLTLPYYPGMPLWLAEGMADLYGNSHVADKTARLGMADVGLLNLLHEQQLIPLPLLFRVDHSSPYYNESSKTSIFYAESWALSHYLMVGDNGAHRQQLVAYLDALEKGEDQDAAATKAFGDLAKLQKTLQWYVSKTSFYEFESPAPAKVPEADIQIRPLSDAEAEAYRGEFLALHGQFKEAEPVLREAMRSDPKLALAQQSFAVFYTLQGKLTEARTALDTAIELDSANWYTRFLRANVSLRGGDSGLRNSDEEADLRAAISANPNFAPAYGLLANHLAAMHQNLPEAIEFATKAARLEPGNGSYALELAYVLAAAGKYDQAQALATRLSASSSDPQIKENTNKLLESLQNFTSAGFRGDRVQTAPQGLKLETSPTAVSSEPGEDEGPEPTPNDGTSRIDGVVTDVACKSQEMTITLSTQDGTVKLHAADNTKVDYVSDVALNSDVFWPCTLLKGRTVHAKYVPAATSSKKPFQGELTGVEIRK